MRQIVRIISPGGTIFDPFTDSGITLQAAALDGYDAVGCELSDAIFDTAIRRLEGGEKS
ncbi:site-specific DNA-methyltransferase [Eubacteriales bacterium OttesenSCG-928-N13]|nr:site-specific DNA-methyltransferase [Eubacteriales bacterium OttesenSCG-928-N13]